MKVELLSITPNIEELIEFAGRTCYDSTEKITEESSERFIKMIIKRGHESVLEHGYATFRIKGGSRSFTHQLVRHRLCSFSQRSQRYVSEGNFNYVIPESIKTNEFLNLKYKNILKNLQQAYNAFQKAGIKNEDARFILPNAVESEIVVSSNIRNWRHLLKIRTDAHAQWEIRNIANEILKIFKQECPNLFYDLDLTNN